MADPSSRVIFLLRLLVTTLTLLHHPTTSHAQTLFVFGDGLYDAGNKQFLMGNRVPANSPPYGVSVGKATGRWSDGLIIPDYLAGFMGIRQVPPILNNTADFSHGASFAVAGATATTVGAASETMTLSDQVVKFSENKNKWTNKARSEAIYLFYIGGDDYLSFVKKNPNPSDDQKQAFADQVITAIDAAIKAIYGTGGRKFAFQNLAPLGCLPFVKQENGNGNECVKLPSEMAALHNKMLLQLLRKLAQDLKGFQYSFYDFFGSILNRVGNPKTFTFETGNAACCGTGSHNGSGCAPENVCAKPEEYVFFDGKHLTQEANSQIGHLIFGADPNVIGPNNLRELLVLPLDVPVIIGGISETESSTRDIQSKIHNAYDIRSLEWGTENQWPYQVEGAGSLVHSSR